MTLAVLVVLPIVSTWWLAPRVYLLADRWVARGRLDAAPRSNRSSTRTSVADRPATDTSTAGIVGLSSMCDAIARALRSGRSGSDGIVEGIDRMGGLTAHWGALRDRLLRGEPMVTVLREAGDAPNADPDDRLCTQLLLAAMVGPTPVAAGVEHAGAVLRDVASTRADLMVATSQARLSARILTVLPLIVLGAGVLTNSTFRSSLLGMSVLVPVLIGVVLNRVGWRWISRLLDGVVRTATRFELAEIVDGVCVALMAGCTLPQACEALDSHGSGPNRTIKESIATRVRRGLPLAECLEPLAATYSLQGRLFADVLVGAERDGLPVVATVARISQDVRIERRRRVDTAIRRIPVSLTIPLVACVLPGFLLTTLVPLVASSVGALTVQLPGVPIPFGS